MADSRTVNLTSVEMSELPDLPFRQGIKDEYYFAVIGGRMTFFGIGAKNDWVDVYAESKRGGWLDYGYNVEGRRWAFGTRPANEIDIRECALQLKGKASKKSHITAPPRKRRYLPRTRGGRVAFGIVIIIVLYRILVAIA